VSAPPGTEVPRVFVETYGCQMNEQDSGKMLALLGDQGWQACDRPEDAGLILINTCSVRDKPEQKVRSLLGRFRALKRQRPELLLGVTGCYAQQEEDLLLQRFPWLDLVMGPDAIPRLPEIIDELREQRRPVLATEQLDRQDYPFVNDLIALGERPVTAFVNIQKGCDNLCAFCVVPQTRGREVSRPAADVLQEVTRLVERGVREVTLLGQNVNSYGLKRTAEPPFHELLAQVCALPGIERVRFTTSNPWDLHPGLVTLFAQEPRLASWFHLPVQAGADSMLKRMRRRHDRARYLELVAALRGARPDIALTTDIIVGFCGETREEHEQTLDLLREVQYDTIYSFCYDERPGTPATRLPDDVPRGTKDERLQEVQALQRRITAERMGRWVGRTVAVLAEGPSRRDPAVLMGRMGQNWIVNFRAPPDLVGQIVPVRVDLVSTNCFLGALPGQERARPSARERLTVLSD
jgi:tRNA-2-methylthio-N6-dimethylallyladenosine synthase